MKVQVTRDITGVVVWKAGVELTLTHANMAPGFSNYKPAKNPIWTVGKSWWPFGKVLFNEKVTIAEFPELYDKLKVGEKREVEMMIII